jgi:hypothetical protein
MMAAMYTYRTSNIAGLDMPSNWYGTVEAIRDRIRNGVDIVDAPPVEVEGKDLCPHRPGFSRKGFRP